MTMARGPVGVHLRLGSTLLSSGEPNGGAVEKRRKMVLFLRFSEVTCGLALLHRRSQPVKGV